MLVLRRGEGAPETLMGASNYSSTSFAFRMIEYLNAFFLSSEGALGTLRVRVTTRAHIYSLGEGAPETLVEMLPMGVKCFACWKRFFEKMESLRLVSVLGTPCFDVTLAWSSNVLTTVACQRK